jgi:alanyl-tRNA synthetase
MANHTATHLLHKALQDVLGDHVRQAGSAVRPDKLRFDFTHPQALTHDERVDVEQRVNEKIFDNLPVRTFETPIEEARNLGAMMLSARNTARSSASSRFRVLARTLRRDARTLDRGDIGAFTILSKAPSTRRAPHRGADERRGVRGCTNAARVGEPAPSSEACARTPRCADAGAEFDIVDKERNVVFVQAKALKGGRLRDSPDRLRKQEKADGVIVASVTTGVRISSSTSTRRSSVAARRDGARARARQAIGAAGVPTLAEAGGRTSDGVGDALAAGKKRRRRRAVLMKVLALDFGAARTGVAVLGPDGHSRPRGVVERA